MSWAYYSQNKWTLEYVLVLILATGEVARWRETCYWSYLSNHLSPATVYMCWAISKDNWWTMSLFLEKVILMFLAKILSRNERDFFFFFVFYRCAKSNSCFWFSLLVMVLYWRLKSAVGDQTVNKRWGMPFVLKDCR